MTRQCPGDIRKKQKLDFMYSSFFEWNDVRDECSYYRGDQAFRQQESKGVCSLTALIVERITKTRCVSYIPAHSRLCLIGRYMDATALLG